VIYLGRQIIPRIWSSGLRNEAKTLVDQVPETRKDVSCVKSKGDEFRILELWSSEFHKS
jgi:hypothetical protein